MTRTEKIERLALLEEQERRRKIRAILGDKEALKARYGGSLYAFVEDHWRILEPKQPFVGGPAIRAICEHLEAVTRGEIQYLLITVPPGMAKSLLVAVFWPAWEWGPCGLASLRYLTSSYSEANVLRDNMKMRRLIESGEYQALWGDEVRLARDQNAKGKFENTATGGREGRSFGSMTGGRGDRVIIDDPHSVDTAESDVQRESTVQTFREAIPDRLNDMQRSAIVVIMQRLHEKDVAGTIISLGLPYTHLNLPMEFEAKRRCSTYLKDGTLFFTDWRETEGELLFPERFPADVVAGLKKAKGSYAYAGQYQQSPGPRDGGIFKQSWFQFVGAVPQGKRTNCRAYDLAATKKIATNNPDWTASVRLSRGMISASIPDGFLIEHVNRFQGSSGEVQAAIMGFARSDPAGTKIRIPQDPGQAGKAQADTLILQLAGRNVVARPPTGDKATRAAPAAVQAEAGNVFILRTGNPDQDAWIEPFLAELCLFPAGAHDDQVDAFADALNELALAPDRTVRVTQLRM